MVKVSSRATVIGAKALLVIRCACLPAAFVLASCEAPPPPATVIERTKVVEHPGLTVVVPVDVDEQRRRDEQQRREQQPPR